MLICFLYVEKCLFKFFAYIKIGLVVFLLLSYENSLYIMDTDLLHNLQMLSPFF